MNLESELRGKVNESTQNLFKVKVQPNKKSMRLSRRNPRDIYSCTITTPARPVT